MITPFKTTTASISGNLSAANLFYDISGNSSQWNSSYSWVSSNSVNATFSTVSALALSTTNIFSYGNETILSDGVGNDDLGNGANTLSLNFAAGVYIGGSGSLTLSAVNGTIGTFTTSVSAPTLSGTHYGDGSKLTGISSYTGSDVKALTGNWQTAYQALSTNPHILNQTLSSTTTLIGSNTANNTFSEVLGGQCNLASGAYSTLVNGFSSCATGYATFVGAGSGIRATGDYSVVNGGAKNTASNCYNTIGGGSNNTICGNGSFGTIAGGASNLINNSSGSVGGGCSNTAGAFAVVAGGRNNSANIANAVIGGGRCNTASAYAATIAGGCCNTASGYTSVVGGGQCNKATANYSTLVGGFSGCATGYATFVGAGSGVCATGDYSVAVGGKVNTASGCYSTIGGGCANIASGACSTVAGGRSNCATSTGGTVGGGRGNQALGTGTTISGGYSNFVCGAGLGGNGFQVIGGGRSNCISNSGYAVIAGGMFNCVIGDRGIISGGCGNYNTLRDSVIVGGIANHTGGYAPLNFVTGTALSGNGSCTCICGTGIQNCFSYPFTSNNISVYYATAANPLSSGCFSTATIAATGTNYVILNTDYSACSNGLSATSLYVYDRAINNTGYDNFIGGGKLNTASACYNFIGGGKCNTTSGVYGVVNGLNNSIAAGCAGTIAGGVLNRICQSPFAATIVGGRSNTVSAWYTFIGGGYSNSVPATFGVVAGGTFNCASGVAAFIGAGCNNTASGYFSNVVSGRCNNVSGCFSTIVGGRFNYNPLYNSDIHGGSFNHTGGYAPANITFGANLSGNGSCTALIATGIGSCFSNSGTTGAVTLVWMTSGTANSTLSSALFTTANIITNAANCIIINGDYSTCSTGFSACSVYVYDRCLNQGGCFNFIGGGVLNTASGCYSVLGGGLRNVSSGTMAIVGGGCCNVASGGQSTVSGGYKNTASGGYNTVGGGSTNTASSGNGNTVAGGRGNVASGGYGLIGSGYGNNNAGGYSAIAGGCTNCACGTVYPNPAFQFIGAGACNKVSNGFTSIVGGFCNTASGNYSFVAGGSANDTKGFANTFILGTALSASAANYTYVNNISSQGVLYGQCLATGSVIAGNTTTQAGCKIQIFSNTGASLGYIQVYSS